MARHIAAGTQCPRVIVIVGSGNLSSSGGYAVAKPFGPSWVLAGAQGMSLKCAAITSCSRRLQVR